MHLSSFYINTITLSCNMSQYNQSTYNTKSHTRLAHYAQEQHNNQNNLHFTNWKTCRMKTVIFVHLLPFWNTNKSDKNIYDMNYNVVNVYDWCQLLNITFIMKQK